ncbi:MAG: DTW domain-containing protein [Oligoflexales bacterium]|nr:DTW domain-containing protein [Oligoflexales bacterium]
MTSHLVKPPKRRCINCRMDILLCVCEFIKPLENKTQLSVYIHSQEIAKPSNTGHLACKAIKNSTLTVRKGAPSSVEFVRELITEHKKQETQLFVLYPDASAPTISQRLENTEAKLNRNLIVVDGTWKQAERILQNELNELSDFHVRLSPENHSKPMADLWREPIEGGLATFEAILWAFAELEPELDLQLAYKLLKIRSERLKWLRGWLTEDELSFPIPELAVKNRKFLAG